MKESDIQVLISLGYELDKENNRLIEEGQFCYYLDDKNDIMELQMVLDNLELQHEDVQEIDIIEPKKIKVKKERKKPLEEVEYALSSLNEVLQDKKFPYGSYTTLMINSKFNEKTKENYIYEKNIDNEVMNFLDEIKKEGGKTVSKQTLKKHIKTMLDSDIPLIEVSNTKNGIVYNIKSTVKDKYYVKIPYMQIKELLISTNKNMLKLFVFLKVMCNETEYTKIDRYFLAEHIGLSSSSMKTLNSISTMTNSLANLGFIEIRQTIKKEVDENKNIIVKTINEYRICTLEEYKEAKNRGKKTFKDNK